MTNEEMLKDLSENGSFSLRQSGDWIGWTMRDAIDTLRENSPKKVVLASGPMGGWGNTPSTDCSPVNCTMLAWAN